MGELSVRPVPALAGVVAVSLALAACGASSTVRVASLGTGSAKAESSQSDGSGASTTQSAAGDPTRLMDEWAVCMRRHGDTGQADPTITADKLIVIDWNPAIAGGIYGTNKGGQGNSGPGQFCRSYLTAAQTALRAGIPLHIPGPATLLKFSECMQANGIPDFPDPTSTGLALPMDAGGDLNPANPTFHKASRVCEKKTGAEVPGGGGTPPPGTIELGGAGAGATAG